MHSPTEGNSARDTQARTARPEGPGLWALALAAWQEGAAQRRRSTAHGAGLTVNAGDPRDDRRTTGPARQEA